MDTSHFRRIAEQAKARGLLQQTQATTAAPVKQQNEQRETTAAVVAPEAGDRERDRRLRRHVRTGLDMDFEVLSAFMSIEVNAEVSPLRLNTILTRRITEMKNDGSYKKVPKVVLEMLDSLRIPNFTPAREPEYLVTTRNGCLVVSGDNVESTLRRKSIQVLLRHCEWRIEDAELILSGGFVAAFEPDVVKRIWRNCQAALC